MATYYKQPWVETPLIESCNLSRAAGCNILLKLDTVQPSGSFKSRGIGNYMIRSLERVPADRRYSVHFYSSSGGNAGLAAVHAANTLGQPSTVVVPSSTKPLMLAKIRAAGAYDVIQHGASWSEADSYLRETVIPAAERRGETGIHVPPFDHPDIWTGNSTLIIEAALQMKAQGYAEPDVVVCSVGGGGLLNGIMEGLAQVGWNTTTVLALETMGAESLHQSVKAGEHVRLPAITSLATSLGATKVSQQTYELASTSSQIKSHVFTDAEATMGCWRFADDERVLVEPACGVSVAVCYGGRLAKALGRPVKPTDNVLVVVCGGSGVTVDMLSEWRRAYGPEIEAIDKQETKVVPSAVTAPNGVARHDSLYAAS